MPRGRCGKIVAGHANSVNVAEQCQADAQRGNRTLFVIRDVFRFRGLLGGHVQHATRVQIRRNYQSSAEQRSVRLSMAYNANSAFDTTPTAIGQAARGSAAGRRTHYASSMG